MLSAAQWSKVGAKLLCNCCSILFCSKIAAEAEVQATSVFAIQAFHLTIRLALALICVYWVWFMRLQKICGNARKLRFFLQTIYVNCDKSVDCSCLNWRNLNFCLFVFMQIYVHEYIRFSAALIHMQCTAYRLQPLPFYANQKKFSFFFAARNYYFSGVVFSLANNWQQPTRVRKYQLI